jgi:hypothetical protein
MHLTIRQLLLPASALTGFALLQTLALLPIAGMDFWPLLTDSLLHSLGCGLLSIPLLNLVRVSRLQALSPTLRFVNYSAYVAVATAAAAGTAYLSEWLIFGTDTALRYLPLIPLRALLNACIFTGILVCVKQTDRESEQNESETESEIKNLHPGISTEQTDTELSSATLTTITYTTRIALRSGTKIHVVPIDEVLYLQADGDYVQVVTPQGRFLKEQTLKSFAEQLPPERFARVHRSILVNIEAISRIERYEKNSQQLRLKNGDSVKVSQQGYKQLRETLGL